MTQYLLGVWHDGDYTETPMSEEDMTRIHAQVMAFNTELTEAGCWVFGGGLHPTSSATVLRASEGGVSMTDGPYVETKEQMGGVWIIEAPDFDAALEWAGKGAVACEGPVELRPFFDE